jgi:predicted nucleic acid-binding protein
MKESIYLETTVVSYYTSKPSRDIVILAHQEITREWWPRAIKRFDIYISDIVIQEVSSGDPKAVKRRLDEISNFAYLESNDRVEEISKVCIQRLNIPEKSALDATHLALASLYDIDYLVTWNCAHLANGEIIKKLIKINNFLGIHIPIICTPEELLNELKEV